MTALALDIRAREIEREQKAAFVEIGLLCLDMEKVFEQLVDAHGKPKYVTFEQWLADAMPTQRSTAYAALKAMRALHGVVPEKELRDMPRCNISTLGKCSTDVARDPEVRAKARTMKENEFVREVMTSYPQQHLEERDPYRFAPSKDQRDVIDAAMDAVRLLLKDDGISREDCLEQLARYFLDEHEDQLKTLNAEPSREDEKWPFEEHQCSVCGTDCQWCSVEIDRLNKELAEARARLKTCEDYNAKLILESIEARKDSERLDYLMELWPNDELGEYFFGGSTLNRGHIDAAMKEGK